MCQVPAETRRPSVPPVLDAAADDSPARPSPPWCHWAASPAGNPPGSRLVSLSIGQKPPCPIWSTVTGPFRPLSPGGTLSPTSGHIPGPADHDRRRIILPLLIHPPSGLVVLFPLPFNLSASLLATPPPRVLFPSFSPSRPPSSQERHHDDILPLSGRSHLLFDNTPWTRHLPFATAGRTFIISRMYGS